MSPRSSIQGSDFLTLRVTVRCRRRSAVAGSLPLASEDSASRMAELFNISDRVRNLNVRLVDEEVNRVEGRRREANLFDVIQRRQSRLPAQECLEDIGAVQLRTTFVGCTSCELIGTTSPRSFSVGCPPDSTNVPLWMNWICGSSSSEMRNDPLPPMTSPVTELRTHFEPTVDPRLACTCLGSPSQLRRIGVSQAIESDGDLLS